MSNLKLKSTTHENLVKLITKSRSGIGKVGNNTEAHDVYNDGSLIAVTYHGNVIARIDKSGIQFTHAGWGTPTTRNRLRIIANDNNVPVNFGQRDFKQTLFARKRMWNQPKEVHTFMSNPVWDLVTDEFSTVLWDRATDTLVYNGETIYSF